MKIFKNPSNVRNPFSSYKHCVEVTNTSKFLFCSGQIPATQNGSILALYNFREQGKQVIENLKSVLSHSGAKLTDIVRLVTYLSRQKDVPAVRELLNNYFQLTRFLILSVYVISGVVSSKHFN